MHAFLIVQSTQWLQKKCSVVITDLVTGAGEIPDAIGWKNGHSILIECKASRADFLADRHKPFRRESVRGMGDGRYFCVPKGMIQVEELPQGWGLLEWTGKKLKETHKPGRRPTTEEPIFDGRRREIELLVSALRRLGQPAAQGISIKCYVYDTQGKATLGVEINSPNHAASSQDPASSAQTPPAPPSQTPSQPEPTTPPVPPS